GRRLAVLLSSPCRRARLNPLSSLLHESGDHRDLPSFPTRRSSDLMRQLGVTGLLWMQVMMATMATWPEFNLDLSESFFVTLRWRSEEHTSELQSRENLVCRLLLEKKKKARDATPTKPSTSCSIWST